jgi:hypothetical protein
MSTLETSLIRLTPPSLPTGYCPTSFQQFATDVMRGTQARFQSSIGNTFFNYGNSTPETDNRVYPWFDLDGNWWNYSGDAGGWIRKHPYIAAGGERLIWTGTLNDLKTFDGGADEVVTNPLYQGPMWEQDTGPIGKFLVTVGALGTSGNVTVGTSITDTNVSGEDKVTLTTAQIPSHNHTITAKVDLDIDSGGGRTLAGSGAEFTDSMNSDSTGSGESHKNIPPFYGIYLIKRTSRTHYRKT